MNKRFFLFSVTALIAAAALTPSPENKEEESSLRKPLPTIIREHGDEEEEQDKFKQWYEQMHKAAPGVDWKKMDAETRQQKYASRFKSRVISPVTTQEVLANGNLIGQWNEKGSANCAGRIWVADLDTSNGAVY